MDNRITYDEAIKLLEYDHETGWLISKVDRKMVKKGQKIGCLTNRGYLQASVNKRIYFVHTLVWLLTKKEYPKNCIDHINGCKTDNKIENLRDVTHKVNSQNKRKPTAHNKYSKILGVSWSERNKSWNPRIRFAGSQINLGHYKDLEKAKEVYLYAKRHLHDGCTI
jgi:hypothetical protein